MPSQLKIFNDPVHGFIEVPVGILLELINHPIVQRLRGIRQMGLSALVYPGAVHTRFSHALGAMHLMHETLATLKRKGVEISPEEHEAALAAILLHDVGHGPFSHSLESVLLPGLDHETLGLKLMQRLNSDFAGQLGLALRIFADTYERRFLHQLISSQLDMDRMDYLLRDSFFTGVHEGIVGTERIIKTLTVHQGRLMVEEKGIYSVEKFLVARRLMYWQVYLHKTALGAEKTLVKLLHRARELAGANQGLGGISEGLGFFLTLPQLSTAQLLAREAELLEHFVSLADDDITMALKAWQRHPDPILADLANRLKDRRLLKLRYGRKPFCPLWLAQQRSRFVAELGLANPEWADFYVFHGEVSNLPYFRREGQPLPEPGGHSSAERIEILMKDGSVRDLAEAADMSNIAALSERLTKYWVCTPAY